MTPHWLSALGFFWAVSVSSVSSPPTAPAAKATVASLPLNDRCAIAGLVAKEMRDLLSWIDPHRLPGVMGDDGFSLLIVRPGAGDEVRSLFERGESCPISLDRVYPSPAKISVRLAEDPPEQLAPGRAYALLFMRQLGRGRWQFDWSLSATGYTGARRTRKPPATSWIPAAPRRSFAGPQPRNLRIVVTRKRVGFEAEVANLEVPTWSAPTWDTNEPSP